MIEGHSARHVRANSRLAAKPALLAQNVGNPAHTTIRASSQPLDLIPPELRFLHRFGIGLPVLRQATENAAYYKITPTQALIRSKMMREEDYYRCAAAELGLDFVTRTPASAEPFLTAPPIEAMEKMAFAVPIGKSRIQHIVPDMAQSDSWKRTIDQSPDLRSRLKVTTRTSNLSALQQRAAPGLLKASIERLREHYPTFSAKQVVTPTQAVVLVIGLQILALMVFFSSGIILTLLHFAATVTFFACGSLRFFAASLVDKNRNTSRPPWEKPKRVYNGKDLPIYSVLVALYKESNQIDGLMRSLARLDWPIEKLEIKLVCEDDDSATIEAVKNALERRNLPQFALICVPATAPRTKPKALNYALPLCKGRYLVIYDAEDRPEPTQLRAAWSAFRQGDERLVCLQAPLIIHNYRDAWLTRLFTIEYSALFDGLLPALAKLKLPLPLGGTSNHFKRAALEKAGGWDPYNVTEDADLGMRLVRLGYKTGTISEPTYEEAPTTFTVWRNQRTRWFKGWMQTWLVHMRHPLHLTKDLGCMGTVVFHLLTSGMILSALIHPLLLYFIVEALWTSIQQGAGALIKRPLFWFDLATVITGYGAFALLAWRTLPIRGLKGLRSNLWTIPVYWILLSIAAWRALFHLMIKPHHWEKTPHGRKHQTSSNENASIALVPEPGSWTSDQGRTEPSAS